MTYPKAPYPRISQLFLGLAALLISSHASAVLVTYDNDLAGFNTAAGTTITEDFATETGTGSPLSASGTALTSITSADATIFRYELGPNATNGIGIQGVGAWNAVFNFSQSIVAFGFEIGDFFENAGESISFLTSAGESGLLTAPPGTLANGNLRFLGLTTNLAFTSITISAVVVGNDGAGLDNITYATSVPAPLPLGLILGSLSLIYLKRRA